MIDMELLAEISDKDFGAERSPVSRHDIRGIGINRKKDDITSYYRAAARAVVFNSKGEILLQHSTRSNFYKLPGGGMKEGETPIKAAQREVLEETGYRIAIKKEIGLILEHRKKINITQFSYCYLAFAIGKQGKVNLDEGEIREGLVPEWHDARKVMGLLRNSEKKAYTTGFMVRREEVFIRKALLLLRMKVK